MTHINGETMIKRLAFGILPLLIACGGSDSTSPTDNPGTVTANITLSGAKAASSTASGVSAAFNSSTNESGIGFQTGTSVDPQVTVAIGFPGKPTKGTYT